MPYADGSRFAAYSLAAATVQDIQLELIRRSRHNNFDGEQVCADLLACRTDWQAVLFDTLALTEGCGLSGLIKLRDLAGDLYNVDTLYVLATGEAAADRLAACAETWLADEVWVYDQECTGDHLGGCDADLRLVALWWD
jgi:hypothetical protein